MFTGEAECNATDVGHAYTVLCIQWYPSWYHDDPAVREFQCSSSVSESENECAPSSVGRVGSEAQKTNSANDLWW